MITPQNYEKNTKLRNTKLVTFVIRNFVKIRTSVE